MKTEHENEQPNLRSSGGNKRQSSRGQYRANQSVSMTTVINEQGVCGGMCCQWHSCLKEEVLKYYKYANASGHVQLELRQTGQLWLF